MAKYLIVQDCGYGEDAEVVEADNQEEADLMAYNFWRESAENKATYYAELATKDNCYDFCLEDELED